jgi:transketolase
VKRIATRQAYGEALAELGAEDPRVVVLDADLSGSTKTAIFAKQFPERFFNFGVAEQNMMGAAAGFARQGKIPFASTFAIFATGRAFEPIRQQMAYAGLNAKVVASHGGVTVGEDGGSHQTVEDLSLMRSLPNMTVVIPADAVETRAATRAIHKHDGPVYMRTGRMDVPVLFDEDYAFELGKANLLRDGSDVTIIACGVLVAPALEAAELLARENIDARVLNMATIKPVDADAVEEAARETGAIVTAEEHSVIGGLGSAVAEALADRCPAPLERVGVPDVFGRSGKAEELLDYFGLNRDGIVEAVRRALSRK